MRIARATLLWSLFLVASPGLAVACVCTDSPSFEERARRATTVWVVRIIAQGRPATTLTGIDPVAYVDAKVVQVAKGVGPSGMVRLWDGLFGSDCTPGFSNLSPGKQVAVIVSQARSPGDLWSVFATERLVAEVPGKDAFFVSAGCSEPWKELATEEQVRAFRVRR